MAAVDAPHTNTAELDKIRISRMNKGWTQADLAEQCAKAGAPCHWTTISKIERGENRPRPRLHAVLCRLLNLTGSEFASSYDTPRGS